MLRFRFAAPILAIAFPLSMGALHAAPTPNAWLESDVAGVTTRWHAVTVAEFPSPLLASGVEEALRAKNWGPVRVEPVASGSRVLVGELVSIAEAEYLRRELARLGVANGSVVSISPTAEAPRALHGPLESPFEIGGDARFAADVLQPRLRALFLSNQIDESELNILTSGLTSDSGYPADLGTVALAVAQRCATSRVEGDLVVLLTCRVADGRWPVTPERRDLARRLAMEMLYGHERDWGAAWGASRLIAAQAADPVLRAEARMMQAALKIELIRDGVQPAPSFVDVRRVLRQAYEAAPEEAELALERIEILYMQTFSWEGNWERVESLADDFLARREALSARGVIARTLLAKSLFRKELFGEARTLLSSAISTPLQQSDFLRLGYTTRDPRHAAMVAMRQLGRLEAGSDPLPVPVTVEQEATAVGFRSSGSIEASATIASDRDLSEGSGSPPPPAPRRSNALDEL